MTKVINSLAKGEHEQKLLELVQEFKNESSYYSQGLAKVLLDVLARYNSEQTIFYSDEIGCVVSQFVYFLELLDYVDMPKVGATNQQPLIDSLNKEVKTLEELLEVKEQTIKLQKKQIAKLETVTG